MTTRRWERNGIGMRGDWGRMKRLGRALRLGLSAAAVAGGLAFWPAPASGITINLVFDAANDAAPPFDPTGAQLTAIMQAVRAHYQDIFEDNDHTITINYRWQDLSAGLLGDHDLLTQTGGVNSRETSALVKFDTQVGVGGAFQNYFFDPTPNDDSEFNMASVLYRDLTPAEQTAFFNGTVPAVFEAGYNGVAPVGSPANGLIDLLSVALHEVGHSLGMSSANAATVAQTMDGDYDVNPAFVRGNVMAINIRQGAGDVLGHLENDEALMFPSGFTNRRERPSAADALAMASGHQYLLIDMPRKDFLGGADWNTAGNWIGNMTPDSADDVFVRHGGDVTMSADDSIRNLFVGFSGTDVFTNNNRLDVAQTTTIQHDGGTTPQIFVGTGGELETGDLLINGAELDMSGGLADVQDDLIVSVFNGFTGRITGNGTVDVAGTLNNNGIIRPDGGTLTFTTVNNGVWDFDGTGGDGVLDITAGNITVSGSLADDFDGVITVGATRTATFNSGWNLGIAGLLELEGGVGSANAATVAGGSSTLRGDVVVTGFARISSTSVVLASTVSIDIDTNATLEIDGFTTYQGGSYVGNGTLKQDGNANITGNTTIGVFNMDLDGDGANIITIAPGVAFHISSNTIDPSDNAYDGTMNINGGQFSATVHWRLDGTINLNSIGLNLATIADAGDLTIHTTGTLNSIAGQTNIQTDLTVNGNIVVTSGELNLNGTVRFNGSATVDLDNNTILDINGVTTYNGGSYVGNGLLRQDGNVSVIANTAIGTAHTDLDGDNGTTVVTINPGVTFSIASNEIETTANDGFDGTIHVNSGTFSVLAGWRLDNALNLSQTAASPAVLTGFGPFTIHTTGHVVTSGNADINPDTAVNGSLTVGPGQLDMNGTVVFSADSVVNVAPDAQLDLNGNVTYLGGTHTGGGFLRWHGNTLISGNTLINMPSGVVDLDGLVIGAQQITLSNRSLTLNVSAIDVPGQNPSFGNEVININGSLARLTINLTNPDASWEMAGTVNINANDLLASTALSGSDILISGTINADGRSRIDARIDLTGDLHTNDATTEVQLAGGTIADVNTIAGGMIDGPGVLRAATPVALVGNGTISTAINFSGASNLLASGGTLALTGVLQDLGDLIGTADPSGTLNVANAWNTNLANELRLNGGVVSGANITNGGRTTGFGTVAVTAFTNTGVVSPGLSTGILNFINYRQTVAGELAIQLGGLTPGTEHDQITARGSAILDGRLNLRILPPYDPQFGDVMTIITSDVGVAGVFANVVGVDAGNGLSLAVLYTPNTVEVRPTLPGDVNVDGAVGITDLSLLAVNFGLASYSHWALGDLNGDGMTNITDLSLLAVHFGQMIGMGGGFGESANSGQVPAPGVLGMLVAAWCAMRGRRRSGKQRDM